MTEQDIQAWEREIEHAAKMQKQRKEVSATYSDEIYEIKDESNER